MLIAVPTDGPAPLGVPLGAEPLAGTVMTKFGSHIFTGLLKVLTHWVWVTYTCISKLTIIDSDNGLSPGRGQAIIWTNAAVLLIQTSGTNSSEIVSEIHTFWFKEMSVKWWQICVGLNVLRLICVHYRNRGD